MVMNPVIARTFGFVCSAAHGAGATVTISRTRAAQQRLAYSIGGRHSRRYSIAHGGHDMRRVMTATLVALTAGSIGLRGADTATRWWSHVEALANDGMEGRNTGSPAHKRAA